MKKLLLIACVMAFSAALSGAADGSVVWDFSKSQTSWGKPRNLKMSQTADGLLLDVTGKDSSIENAALSLNPHIIARIKIEYKAEGFAGATNGEVFFAGTNNPNYKDNNRFYIPSLISDGKPHTIELTTKQLMAGEKSWTDIGTITKLRLDLVNQCPGRIVLRKVMALPPILTPITRIQEVEPSEGILLPREMLEHGRLELTLPDGTHFIWMRHTLSQSHAKAQIKTTPALSAASPKTSGTWQLLGKAATDNGKLTINMNQKLPDGVDSLLLTQNPQLLPKDRKDTTPEKVSVTMGRSSQKALPTNFDPLAPYFKGKMISPQGLQRHEGKLWIRRTFQAPKGISRAILQVTADDAVNAVRINDRTLPVNWTRSWRIVSIADIKPLLKFGTNTVEIEYTNNGGKGGLLFEIDILDTNGNFTYACSDEQCIGGKDNPRANGMPVECELAAPNPPWLFILKYEDIEPDHGSATVAVETQTRLYTDVANLAFSAKATGTPALSGEDVCYIRLRDESGNQLALKSAKLKDFLSSSTDNGSWQFMVKGFNLPEYGSPISGTIEAGIYHRKCNVMKTPFSIAGRSAPSASLEVETAKLVDNGNGPRLEINGKPQFVIGMSTFHDLGATGLEGADSPITVRSFLCGGGECDWWVGPHKFDFSSVEARMSRILKDFPNALIGIWLHCQPPKWYADMYPERISLESNGKAFDYAFSTVTFSCEEYRRDAVEAITAFVEHCEKYFGRRILIYNLCGGISLEWQGWGSHSMSRRNVLADYSNGAQRDFLEYAKKNAPELDITKVPTYEERIAPQAGLFRDAVKEAASILYDEFYSNSIVDCILDFAAAAKKASARRKLVGCYYGYAYEYANKNYLINSAGHNALARIVASNDVDWVLSPPSYGVRTIGSTPGSDMKSFASIHANGKFSVLEDDTRTHLDHEVDFYQTLNAAQTQAVLRRNWGMALANKTVIWHLPLETGHDFGSPEISEDLRKVQKVGQCIFEKDLPRNAEIAVIIDEKSRRFIHPRATQFATPHRSSDYYSHNGTLKRRPRMADALLGELVYFQRIALNQCGAPVDYLMLEDVGKCAGKYKLFIFLDAFAPSHLLDDSIAAIKDAGGSILVAYGAGFLGKDDINLAGMNITRTASGPLMVELRDFSDNAARNVGENRFGTTNAMEPRFAINDVGAKVIGVYPDNNQPAIAVKRIDGSNGEIWFCGSNMLPAGLISAIAAEAGVHIYAEAGDTLFAGCGTLTLHSATAGVKKITLPKKCDVVDLYTGENVAKGTAQFQYFQEAYTTRTFLLK